MSTQLILYPQNYNGYSSSFFSGSSYEFVVNGTTFTSINSAASITGPSTLLDILNTQPPIIVNTWYRSRENAAVNYPTASTTLNVLHFYSILGTTYESSVYQRLDNLVIGVNYTLTVKVLPNPTGIFSLWSINGDTNVGTGIALGGASLGTIVLNFTAQTTQDIILVAFGEDSGNTTSVKSISIKESVGPRIDDGQVICDLYEEEDIPLTLSVDDFKNVAEKVQSYSKDFNLPATKRNNRIFNNMFEVTRADDGLIFNPYVRTKCVLKQDGFILFEGYLRLIDVKDKEGQISYNVNLYSEVVALKEVLENKILANLDFSELSHNYNKVSIKESWESPASGDGLPLINPLSTSSFAYNPLLGVNKTNVLKYPFIDWTHQYVVGGTGTGSNATAGYPELTNLGQSFRPCIQLKYLIDKIFAATNQFTYTSNFFDSTDFGELFMDFNWGSGLVPLNYNTSGTQHGTSLLLTSSFQTIQFPNQLTSSFPPELNYSSGVFTTLADNEFRWFNYTIAFINTGTGTLECQWIHTSGSTVTVIDNQTITVAVFSGFTYYNSSFDTTGMTILLGDTFHLEAKGAAFTSAPISSCSAGVQIAQVVDSVLLETLRGELGQWDFLKGIMTMFNLVTLVDDLNPDNLLIEPYSDVFINNTNGGPGNLTLKDRSIQYDWTDKVDVSEMELNPLTDLNKMTRFQFVEDDDDYVFNVLKGANSGHLYGSLDFLASTSTNGLPTIFSGTKEIIAEPFAATVSKPLMDIFAGLITPAIYALNEDGTSEGFENLPRIFYNNGKVDSGITYYIPPQNGLSSENQKDYLQFSHLSTIPSVSATTQDFVFDTLQLVSGLGTPPVNNLYTNYWSPYFNELYNADTRTMTLKVNLSPSDIANFKFYDLVMIKNRAFRVNKIEYKPNSLAKVEFILIP